MDAGLLSLPMPCQFQQGAENGQSVIEILSKLVRNNLPLTLTREK
jgi:hypothetical protein